MVAIWLNTLRLPRSWVFPGGQGDHQVVAHVEDGVGEGIKEVIADHDPDGLDRLGAAGHGKEQNARDGQQRGGQQQPGPGLARFRAGPVDDVAHDYVGHGVDDFGHDGEHHQKSAAPKPRELENVRVVNVQVGGQHGVQQQRPGGAQQVAQPFFGGFYILRMNFALERPALQQGSSCHFSFLPVFSGISAENALIPAVRAISIAQEK